MGGSEWRLEIVTEAAGVSLRSAETELCVFYFDDVNDERELEIGR